jgi:hypothetical protein
MAWYIHGLTLFVCPDETSVSLTEFQSREIIYLGYD